MPLKQRKVAVMGSRSVGKSSLVIQFVQVTIDHNAIIYGPETMIIILIIVMD